MDEPQVFGIVAGTARAPRVGYLTRPVHPDDLAGSLSDIEATRVLRIAARCEESRCVHFDGDCCSLGQRVRETLPPVVDILPRCSIRATCRWYSEQGGAVCHRCPQVVTLDGDRGDNQTLRAVARPPSS